MSEELNGTGPIQPLSNAEQIKSRIQQLQDSLREQSPRYESLLHEIHVALHKDEECALLLSEEELGTICSGLAKKTGVIIAEEKKSSTKGKAANGKSLKNLSLDDL